MQKLYNNNLESAIQDSFTLSDVSEKEAQHFLKTVKWEDVADIEKSNNAIKALGNGYYADEYMKNLFSNTVTKFLYSNYTKRQHDLKEREWEMEKKKRQHEKHGRQM
ncbi:hypothetical protein [Lactococcus lactis]|uniref:hypothetical protein n=1 Tax=Lactococcus lactis TaxID=1358 RepID=UPI00223B01F3|nr:hypothetical protein [Lactococcus lactis]